LTEQYEHAAEQIFHLTSELEKMNEELSNSINSNKELNSNVLVLDTKFKADKIEKE
jgi:hypothetical protein